MKDTLRDREREREREGGVDDSLSSLQELLISGTYRRVVQEEGNKLIRAREAAEKRRRKGRRTAGISRVGEEAQAGRKKEWSTYRSQ